MGILNQPHKDALSVLTSVGQTLQQVATALHTTLNDAEQKLSILIDEGLAVRSAGDRATALYRAK